MNLFDTHFHYDGNETPEQYREIIRRHLRTSGVVPAPGILYLMANGTDYETSLLARGFAKETPNAWFAAGLHPHCAESEKRPMADFDELLEDPGCAAVGEIGLDYFYEIVPRGRQRHVLEYFLSLALRKSMPAVIHCRDREGECGAYEDMYSILRDFSGAGGRMTIHCFSGTPAWAERMLELGSWLGVTGMVTFSRAVNIRDVLKLIPDDRLLLETDAPYLAPVPYRGKPNTPGYLPLIAARVAQEKGRGVEDVANLATENALNFFGLAGRSGR